MGEFDSDSIDSLVWAEHFVSLKPADLDVHAMRSWFARAISAGYSYAKREASNVDILQNELITYAQCGNVRLQQLVDLFGQMVQDKSGDPATRMQRIDALADIIRNQIQELQTIATPTR